MNTDVGVLMFENGINQLQLYIIESELTVTPEYFETYSEYNPSDRITIHAQTRAELTIKFVGSSEGMLALAQRIRGYNGD